MHQSRQKAMPRPRDRSMDPDAFDEADERRRQRGPSPKARRSQARDDLERGRDARAGPNR
jgi:hypothetical protein